MSDIALVMVGVAGTLIVLTGWQVLPHLWHWLKFKVWYEFRYAQGYRKGLADGRTIARGDDRE